MWGFLVDIANKVSTLYTRLSSARAALLDNLDAAITSRAAAATAVSSVDLTATRIGYLDNIAAAPLSTIINRIQTGYIDTTGGGWSFGAGEDTAFADATITAVVLAKSIVICQPGNWNGYPIGSTARLTSTTNVRASAQTLDSGSLKGRWYVIEFK